MCVCNRSLERDGERRTGRGRNRREGRRERGRGGEKEGEKTGREREWKREREKGRERERAREIVKERGSLDLVGETQSSLAHRVTGLVRRGVHKQWAEMGEEQESRKGAEKAFGFLSYYLWALKCVTTRQK